MPITIAKDWTDIANLLDSAPSDTIGGVLIQTDDEMLAAASAPALGDSFDIIPRSSWKEVADMQNPLIRKRVREVKNQGSEGSCVANAFASSAQFRACMQFQDDLDYILLSAISLYARIGNSPNSGAYVSDGMNSMEQVGILPLTVGNNRWKHHFKPRGFYDAQRYLADNPDWKDTAKLFRAEYHAIRSLEEHATALLLGFPIVNARDRHCIYHMMWDYDSRDNWYSCLVNSWEGWGDKVNDDFSWGLGYDSEKTTARAAMGYACTSVTLREDIYVPELT